MHDLIDILSQIGSPRLLVVGDLMLDRYTWGDAERASPEAPVLVLRAEEQEVRLGGAASVAGLLRGLDAKAALIGVVGDDGDGRTLCRLLDEAGTDHDGVLLDPDRPTTTKERFMGRAANRHPQQILRVDREQRHWLTREIEPRLLLAVDRELRKCQAMLISDYAKGVCSPRLLEELIGRAKKYRLPVLIDPSRVAGYERYRGATLLTPNRLEAEMATGSPINVPAEALTASDRLRRQAGVSAVLIKLDKDGIVLARKGQPSRVFPTRPRPVYDVTGAGDMVLAICGLCRAAAIGWERTVELANIAAGLEVERLGVAPVSRPEIHAELTQQRTRVPEERSRFPQDRSRVRQERGEDRTPPAFSANAATKIVSLAELLPRLRSLQNAGKSIVFTNGCFDLLHVGHATYLEQAAALGDILIVAVNSDAGVRRLKGPGRPVVPQQDRALLLAALACVDFVLIFDEKTPHRLLQQIRPDILVKGGTYTVDEVVGKEIVESYGGQVCVVGAVPGRSTTALLADLRQP